MRIPFATEKVTDMIIRSLRASGLIADDASADSIRSVNNNATESELDSTASGLNYGALGGGGGASLASNEDLDTYIDADALPATPHTNFFRISHHQGVPPTIIADNELMTLAGPDNSSSRLLNGPVLVVGPRASLSPSSGKYAELHVGTDTGGDYFFNIAAGPFVVDGTEGFIMSTNPGGDIEVSASSNIKFKNQSGNVVGGWTGMATQSRLQIGDPTVEAFAIELIDDPVLPASIKHFQVRALESDERTFFFSSSSVFPGQEAECRFAIGGKIDTSWGDPSGTYQDTTALVVSPSSPNALAALRLNHRDTSLMTNQEIFSIDSADTGGNPAFMIRVRLNGNPIFQVTDLGDVEIDGSVSSPATDVAEWVQVEGLASDYEFGTVIVVSANGKMKKSTTVADFKVIGVTVDPKYPALLMGKDSGFDESGAVALGHTPTKTGSLTSLAFLGDISADLGGVSYLKVGSEIVELDQVTYDETIDETAVSFGGGQTVVRYQSGTSIKKGLVPITDKLAMTVCGIVPVRAITTNGTISPGDLLVSAGDGRATKSPYPPVPGTIIGKALGGLTDDTSGQVTGTVKALVNLQ
jgi:hypothetical protein